MADPSFYKKRCHELAGKWRFSVTCREDALQAIGEAEEMRVRLIELRKALEKEIKRNDRIFTKKKEKYPFRIERPEDMITRGLKGVVSLGATGLQGGAYSYEARRIDNAIEECDNAIIQCQAYLYRNPPGTE